MLAGSDWRKPVLNPDAATYPQHVRVADAQTELVNAGALDSETMTFARDHVFDNWSVATRIVSGKATYSGGYHWQLLSAQNAG